MLFQYRTEISTGSKQDFSNLIPADEYRRYSQSGFSGDPSRSEPFLYNSRHNEYPISGTQDPFAGNAQMRTSNQHAPRTPSSDYPYASSRPHLQDPSGNIGYSVPTVCFSHFSLMSCFSFFALPIPPFLSSLFLLLLPM